MCSARIALDKEITTRARFVPRFQPSPSRISASYRCSAFDVPLSGIANRATSREQRELEKSFIAHPSTHTHTHRLSSALAGNHRNARYCVCVGGGGGVWLYVLCFFRKGKSVRRAKMPAGLNARNKLKLYATGAQHVLQTRKRNIGSDRHKGEWSRKGEWKRDDEGERNSRQSNASSWQVSLLLFFFATFASIR